MAAQATTISHLPPLPRQPRGRRPLRALATALAGLLAIALPTRAETLPGAGKTIRFAQSDSLGANYVQDQILIAGLQKLGYKVALSSIGINLFFQAAAQGDSDITGDINYPQREPGYRAVEKQVELVGDGTIMGGGVNGYLIDKKTSDAYQIIRLDQLKDPKLAGLFGTQGRAELINCDPGWSCGDVVDFQIDKFGLKDTVRSVRGKYEALMGEAVARISRGEPALFYAWSPSWVNDALVPGKDVVWLPTPFDAAPPNVPTKTGNLVKGVVGCAAGQDPCRMALGSWNWRIAANREFIAKNPAVKRFAELAQWPLATWAGWEGAINKKGSTNRDIKALADAWIAANPGEMDRWIAEASAAH